jgi:streptogramin lyase
VAPGLAYSAQWASRAVLAYLAAKKQAAESSTIYKGETSVNISGLRPRLAAFLTAIVVSVGLLSLSTAPAWAAAGTVTEFNVPSGAPFAITAGPDGNLWFTDSASAIGRITPSGSITLFPVPGSRPEYITAGPDGNLWFTDRATTEIGRITTGGSFTEFPVPTAGSILKGITAGPDGNLWFTEDVLGGKGNKIDGKIGRITTAGSITEFPLPKSCTFVFCGPIGITAGPDGNLWFAVPDVNAIGRITTAGSITEFTIPTANSGPYAITAGSDGNLWFTEAANDVGRLTLTGSFTQFRVGGVCVANEGCEAFGITSGPDGNLWFTAGASDTIDILGRVTTAGSFTAFPLPKDGSDGSRPRIITKGPDGNLWFTEELAAEIGQITTS